MWWPRPRWKQHSNSDPFADFLVLVVVSLQITAMTAMAEDEGGQRCAGNNNDAVSSDVAVWTTVLCAALFVLVAIAVFYFVYCKKRKHNWSSLWWKNDSGKNIVLQTSAPVKEKSQKNGGTDNPAFLADNNYVVGSRIVRVPLSSTVIDAGGSIGIESSEVDGKQIYTCKQKDGSMDHLIAMRLVFDKEQQRANPSSDLNRALVELSRKYGLRVELETEGEPAGVMGDRPAGDRDETAAKCARSNNNLLSAVCGKAQRLWRQQKQQFVFKDGENNGGVLAAVDNDVEAAVPAAAAAAVVHCSTVTSAAVATVIDETSRKRDGSLRRYNTLEYGASPASAEPETPSIEESSADEQRCSSSSSSSTIRIINTSEEPVAVMSIAAVDKSAAKNTTTVGGDGKRDEPKNAPPPPPPRKYSAPKVDDAGPPASTKAADRAPQTPVRDEIRVDDDYYWCTTTAMAPPRPSSMSTFGKRQCFTADGGVVNDVSDKTVDAEETSVSSALDDGKSTTTDVVDDGKSTTTDVVDDGKSTTTDVVDDGKSTTTDVVDGGGTTSIEDASLPSFPSDDDDDDDDDDHEEEEEEEKEKHEDDDQLAVPPPPQQSGTATAVTVVSAVAAAVTETKSPTKLPTLRLSLSTPPSGTAAVTSCGSSSVATTSSTSSLSSSSATSTSSSPTNNSGLPTVSKIPVRRQSAGTGFAVAFTTNTTNCAAKKSLMFPLSKSTSRLAM